MRQERSECREEHRVDENDRPDQQQQFAHVVRLTAGLSSEPRRRNMADMPSTPRRWTPGRIVLLVLGVLATLTALGLLAAGGALIWAQQTQRDSQGYFTTSAHRFAAQSYALATHSLDVAHDGPNWLFKSGRLGRIRIRATSEKPIFLGIAPAAAVSSYLGSTSYTEVKNVDYHPFRVDYVPKPG